MKQLLLTYLLVLIAVVSGNSRSFWNSGHSDFSGGNNGPVMQCPANITLQVTDLNCRALVNFPTVQLQDSCSYITAIEAFWTDSSVVKVLAGTLLFQMGSMGADTLGAFDMPVNLPVGTTTVLYVATDNCGNTSECSFSLTIFGSTLPTCTAPPDVTVSCSDFDPTFATYGAPIMQGCSVTAVQETPDTSNFEAMCLRGTIIRQFNVFDNAGQVGTCAQKIVVDYDQDYYIRFPDDVLVTVCDSTGIYGQPTFLGKGCEQISLTYDDFIAGVITDACYKIERIWKVVNLCTYDPALALIQVPNPTPNPIQNHPTNLPGPVVSPIQTSGDPWKSTIVKRIPTDTAATNYSIFYNKNANGYTYKQIIKIIDTQAPTLVNWSSQTQTLPDTTDNDPELWNAAYWWDNNFQSHDRCEGPSDLSITATDICSGANINIEFDLFLDLDNNGVMETVIHSNQLYNIGWNNVPFGNVLGVAEPRQFDGRPVPANQKWGFALQQSVAGKYKTARVRFNTQANPGIFSPVQLPHGTHKIRWYVSDGCGNEKVSEYTFVVRDGKPPVVTCQTGLMVDMPNTCYLQIWATDFLQGAQDNCTPENYLIFGVRKVGTGQGFPLNAQGDPITFVYFDGAELGTQMVELWCQDKAGNTSSCQTTIIVQSPTGNCDPFATLNISGNIKTEQNQGIKDVTLNFTGTVNFAPPFSYFLNGTDTAGYYSLQNSIPIAANLFITPLKDDDPLNGVTTYDLVLMSRHILALEPLNSPYKLIAADANKSGSLTTFDIVELRRLILGVYQELPNNTSWRFVPKNYVFPNAQNPFQPPFPEQINIAQILQNFNEGDFVGVKIGDVNNTAVAHAQGPTDARSAGLLHVNVTANGLEAVQAGQVFDLTFRSEVPVEGCQFTLNTPGLEVLDILPGANVDQEHFGLFPERNALTMAWEVGGVAEFTLKCKATQSGKLQDMLFISSRITKAEAYRKNAAQQSERYELALGFADGAAFELFQNQPNPFAGATEISFNLPAACSATLKIMDVNGRTLYAQTGDFDRGMHTITLEKSTLEGTGLLYYTLETASYSATRKMIKM